MAEHEAAAIRMEGRRLLLKLRADIAAARTPEAAIALDTDSWSKWCWDNADLLTSDPTGTEPMTTPDRIAIDANGYGWRVWDDEDLWSMVPTNPDNSPIPQPVTWFVREADHG